jgi:hypothetical protein
MAKEFFIDIDKFKQYGLLALEDTTNCPPGSLQVLENSIITDRGGISPRPGTELIGASNSSSKPITGLYNFRKSFGSDEILIKTYDDEKEALSRNSISGGWFRVKDSYTIDSEHGFVSSLVNNDNQDYVISCNRYEPYERWTGAVTTLSAEISTAGLVVPVTSVLTSDVFESKTATANSATTVDVSGAPWAASQWINFYVYFPSTGKVRKITANTTNQLTFDTLGAGPGNVAFEIRQLAFPATGTIIYNGTTLDYTGIDIATEFTVASRHNAPSGTPVTLIPTQYPAAPRGNRFTSLLGRIMVGNVRSALSRDTGGALMGYSTPGSYFVSKLKDPTDFSFSATRVAGEGDIISTPYGGGDIVAVASQEDTAYIFKGRYIESVKYSQDSNDLPVRTPLKSGIGSIGRVIKGADDIYFFTADNKFTSVGRVRMVDQLPQTENLGFKIKRLIDTYDFSAVTGFEHKDKIYVSCKSSSAATYNDIIIVYSKQLRAYEGIWNVGAAGFEFFNNYLVFGESSSANVYKMLVGTADVVGTTRNPINFNVISHFINLTASKANMQALNSVYFEGYIDAATTVTFKLYKQFENTTFLSFDFSGTETSLLDGSISGSFLGGEPLALYPVGAISNPGTDGRSHFQFRVYFPYQYANYFAFGVEGQDTDLNFELTRVGLGIKEDPVVDTAKIKSL